MRVLAIAWIGLMLMAWAGAARGDVWRIDPDHTEIRFSWDHLGASRQSAEIRDFYGRLVFSPTAPEQGKVEVTMLVKSLASGVAALDTMLTSPDYFDAERFPRITFESSDVRPTGDRAGQITGALSIRDQTHPVTLDVTWNFTGEHPLSAFNPVYRGKWLSGFSATTTIRRSKWGIARATPLVSDTVRVTIEAEFLRVEQ